MIWCVGCASGASDGAAFACPYVRNYPKEFVARMADEIEALPEKSTLIPVLSDCLILRQQASACQRHLHARPEVEPHESNNP